MRIKLCLFILLSVFCINNVTAQKNNKKITITGTVLNVSKEPVVNAIIMIDGKKTDAVTDAEGHYKIKVKNTALKLGVLSFGHGIFEEDINGRTSIDINFRNVGSQPAQDRAIAPGEEGVGTGYGMVKKKNLTDDINKIDGTNKKYASYRSIGDMIQREVSGVHVDGTSVVIQDSRNIWGTVPALIVLDGVYLDELPDIPPRMVKSIEVLKGSSAAIYGSRGFGGAIIIKTKTHDD
jgi:TonB-dependent SusC/RagA subfamily outer membrane receptor